MRVLLCIFVAVCASASPMTIFFTGSGSGSLNGVAFNDLEFTILATAQTSDVQTGAGYARVPHQTAQIEIPIGPGIFSFTVPTSTLVLNGISQGIFAYNPTATHLIAYTDPSLAAYALDQTLGVIVPSITLLQWGVGDPVMTDGGRLIFNDFSGVSGIFSVQIGGDGGTPHGPVPEPSTWAMLAAPLTILLVRRLAGR